MEVRARLSHGEQIRHTFPSSFAPKISLLETLRAAAEEKTQQLRCEGLDPSIFEMITPGITSQIEIILDRMKNIGQDLISSHLARLTHAQDVIGKAAERYSEIDKAKRTPNVDTLLADVLKDINLAQGLLEKASDKEADLVREHHELANAVGRATQEFVTATRRNAI
jgi:hypothetical protein